MFGVTEKLNESGKDLEVADLFFVKFVHVFTLPAGNPIMHDSSQILRVLYLCL